MKYANFVRQPRAVTAALVVLYGALLHWCYATMISPAFDYRGITYRAPALLPYFGAIFLAAAVSALLAHRLRRPSDLVLWLTFLIVVVPSMLVPHYADVGTRVQAVEITALVGGLFACAVVAVAKTPSLYIRAELPVRFFWGGIATFSLGIYAYIHYHVGLEIKLVALADVYDLRFEYREVVAEGSAPLLGYLVRWQAHVINPLIIARGIFTANPFTTLVGVFGQLILFPVTGFKMTLLSIPLLLAFGLVLRWGMPRALTLVESITAAVFISVVADRALDSLFLTTFFVDRLLLTPGVLTAAYVDIFNGQPKAIWADGILSRFVDYPYDKQPPFIVGEQLHGDPDTYANANLFADGYANLGYPGMLLETGVLVLILVALNAVGRRIPLRVTTILVLMPTLATANSGILTSLLTNGYALTILLLLVMPTEEWMRTPVPVRHRVQRLTPSRAQWRRGRASIE